MSKVYQRVLSIIVVLFCAAALAQSTPDVSSEKYQFTPISTSDAAPVANLSAETTTPAKSASETTLDDKHKLLAGDRVSFRIEEDRDPSGTPPTLLTVTDSGELNVPYIGLVAVAGKTCSQAAAEIKALLEKDYYYKATVILGLDQATKIVGRFNINGNIRNPGVYELPVNESFTAGKAITRAGGFADFADKKSVKVIRSVNGQKQTFEINMVEIWEKGKIEKDIPILPDDYIFVPQKLINF